MAKGKIKYVPEDVMAEVRSIMSADRIHGDAEGFRRMADYAKVGRVGVSRSDPDFSPLGVRRKRGGR